MSPMSEPRGRTRPRVRPTRAETREKLIDAAFLVFSRVGVARASIDDIVEQAGYTKGAFYSSFRDKDDILLATVERRMSAILDGVRQRISTQPTWAEFVDAITGPQEADWSGPENERLAHEMYARALHHPELADRLNAVQQEVKATVARGIEATWVDLPVSADDVAEILLAFATGLHRGALLDSTVDADRLFRDVGLRLLTDGLKAAGGQKREDVSRQSR
jgi:AcrR family transcriptional regulator